jgi:PAS domain S-box-containing protein
MSSDHERHLRTSPASDRLFRLLAEAASDAIVIVDVASTILFVNQAAERIFGYHQGEMQGASLTLLMPDYLRHAHEAGMGRYLSTRERHLDWSRIQLPGLHKDGYEIALEVSFGESVDDRGRLFTGIIRDVTEQKRVAEALLDAHTELEERVNARTTELREREQQLRALFEGSPDAIFVEDLQGYVLDVNPAACEFHGLAREQLVGIHVSSLVPPEDRERVKQEYPSFVAGERTRHESVSWVEGRGRVPVEIHSRPIEYQNQPALLLHVRDISERWRIEEARQQELALTQAVLENITDAVVACDAKGRLSVFNQAARELHGLQEQPLAADVWAEVYNLHHPDGTLMKAAEVPLYRAWQGERVTGVRMQILSPDRGARSMVASGRPILNASGDVLGAVVAMRDITEQEQAREMAESAHLQLVEAIETLSEGFALYDSEDRLVLCNDKYREIYAATGRMEEGQTFEEIIRQGVARGQYQEALGREEAFVRERLERHRNPSGVPIEQELGDGRWLRILERRTRDGGIVGIRTDITELKRREQALRESEERWRKAFRHSPVGQVIVTLDGKVVSVNQALCRFLGYSEGEFLELAITEVSHPEDYETDLAHAQALLRGELEHYVIEKRYRHKQGQMLWGLLGVTMIKDHNGRPSRLLGQVIDITARKHAEEELRESEERWRTFVESHPNPILLQSDFRIMYLNKAALEVYGAAHEDELVGRNLLDFVLPDERPVALECLEELQRGQRVAPRLYTILRLDGVPRQVEAYSLPISFKEQSVIQTVFWDVTEQRQVEKDLQEARSKMAEARESERLHIARELHDSVMQQLLGVSYASAEIERRVSRLPVRSDPELPEDMRTYRQEMLKTVTQLRQVLRDLRPAGLEELGLVAALQDVVDSLQRTSVTTLPEFELDLHLQEPLPPKIALTLFRVTQEAIRNAVKHAGARTVVVQARQNDAAVTLTVADDGRGFQMPDQLVRLAKGNHFGLIGLQEYVQAVQGTLELTSTPGEGTRVMVIIPMPAKDH